MKDLLIGSTVQFTNTLYRDTTEPSVIRKEWDTSVFKWENTKHYYNTKLFHPAESWTGEFLACHDDLLPIWPDSINSSTFFASYVCLLPRCRRKNLVWNYRKRPDVTEITFCNELNTLNIQREQKKLCAMNKKKEQDHLKMHVYNLAAVRTCL